MNRKQLGLLLMIISAIGLAVATIMMKILPAETGMTPGQIAVWRFLIAAPLMWLIMLIRKKGSKAIPGQFPRLLLLGGVYSMASLLALLSLDRLPSSIYVIIVFFYPSLIVIYHLIRRQPVPRLWWLGLPLTLIGLTLTVSQFGQALELNSLGIILAILNGIAMAVYVLWSEKVFSGISNRQMGSAWVMTGAMVIGLVLIFLFGFKTPDTGKGWVLLFTLGIVGTLVPIFAMNVGIQMLGSARSSVISTLQPLIAVVISTVFLHDVLTITQWIGGIMVIVAIFILQRSRDEQSRGGGH